MYGSSLDGAFTACLIFAGLVGAAVVGLALWLVPLLWAMVKPLLHAITA